MQSQLMDLINMLRYIRVKDVQPKQLVRELLDAGM